jgi:hypothetical protein
MRKHYKYREGGLKHAIALNLAVSGCAGFRASSKFKLNIERNIEEHDRRARADNSSSDSELNSATY